MRERRSRESKQATVPAALTEAQQYEEHSLRELRNAGYRITMPRVQVIRALADTKTALSAYAIHEKIISGGGKIDVVSVYRILSTLQEVGLIHHIGIVDGYFPAKMMDGNSKRSEVVVDESTNQVTELKLPQSILDAIEEQAREHGFEATAVKVEIRAHVASAAAKKGRK
ncbi:transcriptional repressor [bacterium]|nr:MAG: transcriptional repressor [bacterium]